MNLDYIQAKLRIKGGSEANVSSNTTFDNRELVITTDTDKLYVGKGAGNLPALVSGVDPTLVTRVQNLENQAASIFTVEGDTFSDESKVLTNDNLLVDATNGLIRSKISSYAQDFATDETYDQTGTDSNVNVTNNGAFVTNTSLGLGYVPTDAATSNEYKYQYLKTESFDLTGATQIRLNTSFSTTPISGARHTSPIVHFKPQQPTGVVNSWVSKTYRDSNSNIWTVAFMNVGSGSTTSVRIAKDNTDVQTLTSNYTTAQSDTSRRCVAITETSTHILVAYPYTAATYRITQINKTTNAVGSTITFASATATAMQQVSILQNGNRLHILGTVANGTTTKSIIYAFTDSFVDGTTITVADANYFIRFATPFIYGVRLVKMDSTKIGWCGFTANSSTAVHFGIIDEGNGTFPHQFRTAPVAVTSGATYPYNAVGCATVTSSCNGMGAMAYDGATNNFFLIWGVSGNTQAQAVKIEATATATIPTVASLTATPFETVGLRDMDIIMDKSTSTFPRKYHVVFHDGTRLDLKKAVLSVTSGNVYTIESNKTLFRGELAIAGFIFNIDIIPRDVYLNSNQMEYDIYFNQAYSSANIYKIEYKSNITPVGYVKLMTPGGTTVGTTSDIELLSQDWVTFNNVDYTSTITIQNPSTTNSNNVCIQYKLFYPILFADFSGTDYSIKIKSFTIEKTLPVSSGGEGLFISVPLITDRMVKSVTLNADQQLGISGNSVNWYVRALNNTTWRNVTNGGTYEFLENEQGSYLQVKGQLNYVPGATTINDVPRINSYQVSVSNVITSNELLPMQINLMKLGVNVTALTTANRYNYKNMMIDTFETSLGIENLNGLTHSNHNSTLANNTGSNITVVTTKETADVTAVTNMILVAEYTGTITFRVSRNNGTSWLPIQKESILDFTGVSGNEVLLEATFAPNASCVGWAYLYA